MFCFWLNSKITFQFKLTSTLIIGLSFNSFMNSIRRFSIRHNIVFWCYINKLACIFSVYVCPQHNCYEITIRKCNSNLNLRIVKNRCVYIQYMWVCKYITRLILFWQHINRFAFVNMIFSVISVFSARHTFSCCLVFFIYRFFFDWGFFFFNLGLVNICIFFNLKSRNYA